MERCSDFMDLGNYRLHAMIFYFFFNASGLRSDPLRSRARQAALLRARNARWVGGIGCPV